MKTLKKIFTALLMVGSLMGMSYSTSAVAMGGQDLGYGQISNAINNVIELLNTAHKGIENGVSQETLIKVMKAARQESKEITGDNFGAELDFAQDDLKRAYKSIKDAKPQSEQVININAAISAFNVLKKLAK